jgi:hypothetical protein
VGVGGSVGGVQRRLSGCGFERGLVGRVKGFFLGLTGSVVGRLGSRGFENKPILESLKGGSRIVLLYIYTRRILADCK